MVNICVIGAGVVGLSTALQLQERFPGHSITIIADKFNSDTLSHGAGGIFRISPSAQGILPQTVSEWIAHGYKHYSSLLRSEDCCIAGIQEVSGYFLFHDKKNEQKEVSFLKFTPSLRVLTEEELQQFPGGPWKGGLFYTTVLIDCSKYLPYMLNRFKQSGGAVVGKTVESLEELAHDYDIVMNCTGLRAGDIVEDTKLVPLRGQVYRVKAPWIKHFYYADLDTYILPSTDTVVLGGTRQYCSFNTDVDRHDSESIFERCCQLLPSLKHAEIVQEWVGLRPHRDPIRVEKEVVHIGNRKLHVVHNYGHGGYGISLSWGSAKEATDLVANVITDSKQQNMSKL